MTEQLPSEEEKILFHALGYEYKPLWNATRREIRNDFYGEKENPSIKKLLSEGYMEYLSHGWIEELAYYRVTDKGIKYVQEQYELQKKAANKPSRSKRRYQEYLCWLTVTDELRFPNECEYVKAFKAKWKI